MAQASTKICRDCGRELPLSMFYKNGTGHRPECKECKQKAESERRSKDVEVSRAKEDCKAELDRLIPSKGYVKGNVRWISSRANRLKSDVSIDELKKILKYMEEQIEHS